MGNELGIFISTDKILATFHNINLCISKNNIKIISLTNFKILKIIQFS